MTGSSAATSTSVSAASSPTVQPVATYARIEQQARVTRWVEIIALTLMVVAVVLCVYSVVGV